MKKIKYLLVFLLTFISPSYAQVKIIEGLPSYEFRDMGYDAVKDEVGIVGYEVSGATKTAKLFELNAAKDGFVANTLVGLGSGTQVFGISSDATRLAGVSQSPGSIGAGEGTTWLRATPSSPVGIGYLAGLCANTSVGIGAWKDGVVGDCGGAAQAVKWTQPTGILALGGHNGGGGTTFDVSSNGSVIVGFANHENFNGAAYYWDSLGIHRLPDTFPGSTFIVQSIAYSISPSGNYIGGYISEDDGSDNGILHAVVWDSNRNLILLKDFAGNPFQGKVLDVSDLGYAVGTTSDGKGFIWHPTFNGVLSSYNGAQIFDTWLATIPNGVVLTPSSKGVEAIAQDTVNGKLLFALSDYENPGTSAYVEANVAGVAIAVPGPTHLGTEGADTFTITANANQTIYVKSLGGIDRITISVKGAGARIKIESGAGADIISVRADNISDLKTTILAGDANDTVSFVSAGGTSLDLNLDLGEGNDSFTNNMSANVRNAVLGVKGQGGIDTITNNVANSRAVVTAFDLGDGDDKFTSSVRTSTGYTISDLSLAVNGGPGTNTIGDSIKLTTDTALLTQGIMLGDGKNTITETHTRAHASLIAYSLGKGTASYTATYNSCNNVAPYTTSADQVTLAVPVLNVGATNTLRLSSVSSRNIGVNLISTNTASIAVTKTSSTNITSTKYATQPGSLSTGAQVYNQIVATFDPYN